MHKLYLTLITLALLAHTAVADTSLLLAPYPGKNQQTTINANTAIINSSADTIKTLCRQLLPFEPTKDLKERYALDALARYVMRPNVDDSERLIFATALCEVLPTLESDPAKRFVIVLLERCGKDEAIPVLSTYLNNPDLCEVAIHSLVRIDSQAATAVMADALMKSNGIAEIKLIHALGVQQHRPSIKPLIVHANNADKSPELHDATLTALSNIGAVEAAPLIFKAINSTNTYDFINAVARYQHLGETLLAQNNKREAAKIFSHILNLNNSNTKLISGIYCSAIDGLVEAIGERSTKNIIELCSAADFALMFKIAKIADTLNTRDQIYAALAEQDIYFNYRLLALKGSKGDTTSTLKLLAALKNDTVNRERIYLLTRTLDQSLVTDALLDLCADSNQHDATIIWTLEMPSELLYPKLKSAWSTATPDQLVAYINIVDARRSLDFEDLLLAELESKSSNVKTAAITALGNMESKKAIAKLLKTYAYSESRRERIKALRVIANFSKKTGDISHLTALMVSPETHKEILPFMASIGGKTALDKTVSLMTSSDPIIPEAATRALLKWQQAEAIPHLLKLAEKTIELKYNAMALASIVRLAPTQKGTTGIQTLNKAHSLAKRPEEKAAIASAIFNTVMNNEFTKKLSAKDIELLQDALNLIEEPQKTKMAEIFKLKINPALQQ